jgi:hypothetical protein
MAFTMVQDGAVFIWTFTEQIDSETFLRWFTEMRAASFDSPLLSIYHVIDVREAHTDFGAIMTQMRHVGEQPPDVVYKGRNVRALIVGMDAMARLASDLAKLPQFGGFTMPVFRTLDDALDFIRVDQQKPQNVRES